MRKEAQKGTPRQTKPHRDTKRKTAERNRHAETRRDTQRDEYTRTQTPTHRNTQKHRDTETHIEVDTQNTCITNVHAHITQSQQKIDKDRGKRERKRVKQTDLILTTHRNTHRHSKAHSIIDTMHTIITYIYTQRQSQEKMSNVAPGIMCPSHTA